MLIRQSLNNTLRRAGFGLVAAFALTGTAVMAQTNDLDNARGLIEQGRYKAAVAEIETYLQQNSQDPQARFLHALALARSGDQGRAIEVFSKLAADFPDLAEPRNNLGVLFAQSGQYEKAREALTAAVAIDPDHAPAQENLGDVHIALAQQAYASAARVEGDNRAVRAKDRYLKAMLDDSGAVSIASQSAPAAAATSGTEVATASKPAKNSSVSIQAPATRNTDVLAAVEDWASAWSRQDVNAYLGSYADEFNPDGLRRSTWERQRRERLKAPKFIRIEIADVRITPNDQGDMNVSFEQSYNSDTYQDKERKILVMREDNGRWMIVRETTL